MMPTTRAGLASASASRSLACTSPRCFSRYALDHSGASHGQHHNLHELFRNLSRQRRRAVERKYTKILNSTMASALDVAETVDSLLCCLGENAITDTRYFWEPSRSHISEQASILFAPDLINPLINALFIVLHNYPSEPIKKRYDTTFQSLAESWDRPEGSLSALKSGSRGTGQSRQACFPTVSATATSRSTTGLRRGSDSKRLPPEGKGDGTLGFERRSATAGRLGIRVLDGEPATCQIVDEINFGSREVANADGIDVEPDAVRFEHLVGSAVAFAFFDHQTVLEAGASAALDEHAQPRMWLAVLTQQVGDFRRCDACHGN